MNIPVVGNCILGFDTLRDLCAVVERSTHENSETDKDDDVEGLVLKQGTNISSIEHRHSKNGIYVKILVSQPLSVGF